MLTIRKNGGASIVSLPKALLTVLGLSDGSRLSYTIEDQAIVLRPVHDELTVEQLFEHCEPDSCRLSADERAELHTYPVGNEVI